MKDFPPDMISCLDWALLFFFSFLSPGDKWQKRHLSSSLFLFFVDRVVTMHYRLFSLTRVTCQLRHCVQLKELCDFKRECQSSEKNHFSLLKISLQVWKHCSHKSDVNHRRGKQSNLLRRAVKRERGRGNARINKPSRWITQPSTSASLFLLSSPSPLPNRKKMRKE